MSIRGWSGTEFERKAAGVLALAVVILLFTAAAATGAVGHRSFFPEAAAAGGSRFGSAVLFLQEGLPPVTTPATSTKPITEAARTTAALSAPTTRPAAPRRAPITVPPAGPSPAQSTGGYGCGPALAWLSAHAAPGFSFVCPGYALGHQAMTCRNIAGVCPGQDVIVIADPCPAAYENEAWNSLLAVGLASGPVDPFGACRQ